MLSHLDPLGWWVPDRDCLARWFRGAGFTGPLSIDHTVRLTADQPFVSAKGRSTGADQTQILIDAQV